MSTQTIFFLGATGYLGSEFLILLNRRIPELHVVALLRSPTPERQSRLKEIYPNISFVEGALEDDAIIQREVAKANIVINCASSDHLASVKSTLAGLETNSQNNPGKPPLYIHVSGCGIISDNARGEPVEHVKEWSDIGLDLKQCDQTNTHLDSDIPIVEAGSRKENPVRTIIVYPAQIYGVGEGVQKTTLWLRIFLDMTKKLGFAGTWGPGANSMNNIHIKDCAMALFMVLDAALQGKAEEGPEGIYFASTMAPKLSYHDWTEIMGNYLHSKGIISQPGTRPMPNEVVEPLGHYGWSLLGGNQFSKPERLARLGWEPVETRKLSLADSFPAALDAALEA
ncbi:NAD(P)-binding protein [Leucogyrophana mollusca]|uniref:NAD(P)-binding protein n=1 Tax=Leucogyrophana mollusca TaxID=85980 RepID=A0ACB8B5M6_9AGAM|nr:NAD(P)-binding protein [Leucogyrophana mollusca]